MQGSRRKRRSRGRPARIGRADVVRAARRIGLERLSMRAVADELGVTPAALYTYVRNLHDLRRLVAAEAVGPIDFDLEENAGWQDLLRHAASVVRQLVLENPGSSEYLSITDSAAHDPVMQLVSDGVEHLLRRLRDAGFDEPTAARVLHMLFASAWVTARDQLMAEAHPSGRHPQWYEGHQSAVEQRDEQHPLLIEALRPGGPFDDHEGQFRFQVEILIAGLEARLRRET